MASTMMHVPPILCLCRKSSSVHHPLFSVYVWLVCDCSVSSLNSHTGSSQYKHRAQEILSCLDSGLQNLNVNRHRLIWRTFPKLPAISRVEFFNQPLVRLKDWGIFVPCVALWVCGGWHCSHTEPCGARVWLRSYNVEGGTRSSHQNLAGDDYDCKSSLNAQQPQVKSSMSQDPDCRVEFKIWKNAIRQH